MRVLIPYLFQAVAAFVAITLHEFTKAAVSAAMGDKKPAEQGRLTLNPLKHFEFFGFFAMWYTGLGWGKPVETSGVFYKDRRTGTLLTYCTPIAANLLAGLLFALSARAVSYAGVSYNTLVYILSFLRITAFYNVTLAIFNLIPVSPLSGAKILALFLKPNAAVAMSRYEKVFQIILLVLVFMGILSAAINPAANFILRLAF